MHRTGRYRFATACLAAITCAIAAFGCRTSRAVGVWTPGQMNPTGFYLRGEDGSLAFAGLASLEATVHLRPGPVSITVVGRGGQPREEYPRLDVYLDAFPVGSLVIASYVTAEHTILLSSDAAVERRLQLVFPNYLAVPGQPLAARFLEVTKVIVRQP